MAGRMVARGCGQLRGGSSASGHVLVQDPELLGAGTVLNRGLFPILFLLAFAVVDLTPSQTSLLQTNQKEITMKFMMLMIPAVYQGGNRRQALRRIRRRWKRWDGSTKNWTKL